MAGRTDRKRFFRMSHSSPWQYNHVFSFLFMSKRKGASKHNFEVLRASLFCMRKSRHNIQILTLEK